VELKARQRWKYKCPKNERDARVVICKVEGTGENEVFHVRVENLWRAGGQFRAASHLPVSRHSLESCLTELVGDIPLDDMPTDWKVGYKDWKDHRGGVWTIPLTDCLDALETTITDGIPVDPDDLQDS
jgi:hypothetical protein